MVNDKKSSRQSKVVLPILLSALLVMVICGLVMFYVKTQNVEQVGVNKAKALADQITLLRTFYTVEVVGRAKRNHIKVNYDWDQDDTTLPLPATFTNEVGRRIARENPGTSIRLYSRYPFPHRQATETYDQFEYDALDALEQDPQRPFYRLEEKEGRLSVRYAIADVMRPACVNCHNTHPETPKTGWNVGDVRGIVEVIAPVDDIEHGLLTGTLLLLLALASGLTLVVGVSHFSIKKPLRETVNVMSSTSAQMAATVEQQEKTAVSQSASVTQTTETMEGLSASSGQVAQQSESAAHRSQQASHLAQEGALMVQRAMDEIQSVKDRVKAIADQIGRLSDQTGKIGNITKLVSDLANQTNLLALNAAVEAARAGEHGKGFGVVAGEIRKLADQSKASAEKIHTLLEDIQRTTDSTVSVTRDGTHTAEQAVQMARHAADKFADVRTALDLALENAQQISLNAKQQAAAVKHAVDTMGSIKAGAQETAAGLHETRAGIQTLNEAAQRLKAM